MSQNRTVEARNAKNARDIERVENEINDFVSAGLAIGVVVRTGVGSYDCLVETKERQIPCIVVRPLDGVPFGFPDTAMPKEGSNVVIVTNLDSNGVGYIIGCVGTHELSFDASETPPPLKQNATCRSGPNRHTERIYTDPIARKDGTSYYSGDLMLADVFPGEFVRMNENGVGIDCDTLSAAIRGGSARVSVSRVDNTVEVVACNFRQYDVSGTTKLAVDAGCITKESTFAQYEGERKGGTGLNAEHKKHSEGETIDDRPVGKYRLRSFVGYLGGIISHFISKPKGNTEAASGLLLNSNKEPENTGLLQFNVNDNGRVLLRSAGGFALERCDRIPVPIRIRDVDDPAGIKAADIDKKDELTFDLPEDDNGVKSPHYVPLALADKLAYDYRAAYGRFLEHISNKDSSDAKNDFYIKNEEDVDELDDDAGIPGRKVKQDFLEMNRGRRSGIYNLPDGSLIFRDAWGSEIVMSGGNITFNTPGCLYVNPGHSVIATAGDDVILKARNSIDIETTEHDISIHADKNLRIAAGSDNSPGYGGVVIESLAKADAMDYEDLYGEEATLTGVVIKSNDSHVALLGRRSFVGASDEVRIVTGSDSEDDRTGRVSIATGSIGAAANDGILLASGEGGLSVSGGSTSLIGSSVAVISSDSVVFSTKSQIGVPIWLDISFDMVTSYMKQLSDYCAREQKDSQNAPISMVDLFSNVLFTYRTSEQFHTLEGFELTDTQDAFTLYQPYWSVLAGLKVGPFKDFKLEEWADHTVNGEYPWPGTEAVENGHYATLEHPSNETLNQKKISVKVKGQGSNKENAVEILCSKGYDAITGSAEDGGAGARIKLNGLNKFIVPAVSDQTADNNKK